MSSSSYPLARALSVGILLAASLPLQAGVVTHYGVIKERNYEQFGPVPGNPPTLLEYTARAFTVVGEGQEVLLASVTGGSGGLPQFLFPDADNPSFLTAEASFASEGSLDAAFPNGTYTFSVLTGEGDQLTGGITLGAAAYPAAPALKNFAAAQDIDRTQSFTLQWDKPAELDANDYVLLQIEGEDGVVTASPYPWEAGALPGTTTSFTIPANTLPATGDLQLYLNFVNVTTTTTTGIPDAVGLAGYISETTIPLKVKGSGGGDDTTPPVMFTVQPVNGATGVSTDTVISFTFSEPMQAQQGIQWTGVPNPTAFTYVWSGNGTTLNCTYPGGFPANTTISWQLVPANFRDVAGNELAPFQLTGQFTTGSGSGNCQNGIENQSDTFVIARLASFRQESDGAPVSANLGEGAPAAGFFANFRPVSFTATGASVQVPGGQTKTLTPLLGFFLFQEGFANEAAMTAAYPAGNYTANVQHAGGTASQTVALGAAPTTPRCANFTAAQAINPAADFVLTWDAFAGATANDFVEITIRHNDTEIFRLPDNCATPPKPLAATATSVTIPANLLQAGETYTVVLTFIKGSERKSNTSPRFDVVGGYSKTTAFNIKAAGGNPNLNPVITAFRIAGDQHFEADVTASAGRTLTLEASGNYSAWTTVGTTTVPGSGKATVRDSRTATESFQAYRVRSE